MLINMAAGKMTTVFGLLLAFWTSRWIPDIPHDVILRFEGMIFTTILPIFSHVAGLPECCSISAFHLHVIHDQFYLSSRENT